jgi:cell division protein FtsB
VIHADEDFGAQRDYKAERDSLIDDIAVLRANNEKLEQENHDLKKRNALLMNTVDDSDKENKHLKEYMKEETFYYQWQNCIDENEKLERENEKLKATNENLNNRVRNLNLNGQIQHDELMSCDEEVRYWKDKYTTLTNHIRDMKFASPYSYNYIHLVNFIKELEDE